MRIKAVVRRKKKDENPCGFLPEAPNKKKIARCTAKRAQESEWMQWNRRREGDSGGRDSKTKKEGSYEREKRS